MCDISKKLHRKLASKADGLPTKEPKRRPGELLPGGVRDVGMLIKDGLDRFHAATVFRNPTGADTMSSPRRAFS